MITLHDSFCENFKNNGLGILRDCISAEVNETLNGELSLQIKYPVGAYLYTQLVEGNIIMTEIGYGERQAFRIQTVTKYLKEITVYATHIFYDLSDNLLEDIYPRQLTGGQAISYILGHTQFTHNFQGTSDIKTISTARIVRRNVVEALLGEESNSFVSRWGGEIERDNFNINMLQQRGKESGMQIRYSKNLTGVEYKVDRTNIATRIMPKGFDALLLPELYVDSPKINLYPHPIIKIIEYSDVFIKESEEDDDGYLTLAEAYTALRTKARKEFANGIDLPSITTTVDFIELGTTEEYKQYKNLESLSIGDKVSLYIPYLNVDVSQRVYKTTYDVLRNKYTKFEMGAVKTNYVSQSISSNSTLKEVTLPNLLELANKTSSDIVSEQVENALSGNIVKTNKELYIMDTDDVATAVEVWRWDKAGLGYSNTGINGPYTTVMTKGKINADIIRDGKITTEMLVGTIATSMLTGKITTEMLIGTISTSMLTGKITTSMLEGKIATSMLTGKIATDILEGTIETNRLIGKIATEMLVGTIATTMLTGKIPISMIEGDITTDDVKGEISANIITSGILKAINDYFKINLDTGDIQAKSISISELLKLNKISMNINEDGVDFFFDENEAPLLSLRNGMIGINKIAERGALDIAGDIYVNDIKLNVEDTNITE